MNLSRKESRGQAERRATVGEEGGKDEELVVGGFFSGIPSARLFLYPLLYCGGWDVETQKPGNRWGTAHSWVQ